MPEKDLIPGKAAAGSGERTGVSRRNLLIGGGAAAGLAALAGAGAVGYAWPRTAAAKPKPKPKPAPTPAPTPTPAPAQGGQAYSFLSRPDLQPTRLSVDVLATPADVPPYVFLVPKAYKGRGIGQRGLLIAGRDGDVVWFQPGKKLHAFDFDVQTYKGKPVLTWWYGDPHATSHGVGNCYIIDSTYARIAEVKCGNGLLADLHEFNLTSQDTALVDAYKQQQADMTSIGGRRDGVVLSGVVQEIDVATGDVIFEWSSLDHVPLTESMFRPGSLAGTGTTDNPYDYFHINSIGVAWDGDLLVSARNTSTVYKIGRHDGLVKWRLGGKSSNFSMGPGAKFYYQHHVRAVGAGVITIFDDGSSPRMEPQSRGIILNLDLEKMAATLRQAFTSPARLLADNQGSMQLLPDGRAFVGWGAEPYYTEFDANGSVIMQGQLPNGDQSYRTFTRDWTGHPVDRPAVALRANSARGAAVHVSWNGATEVAAWRVLAGKHQSSLAAVATQSRTGFETMIAADSTGPYFAVTAHDASGKQLGESAVAKLG
ncbi:MAG: arylsulfotransferase family protein [Trebonia sp.]